MTNTTATQTITRSAADEAYYVAAEKIAVNHFNIPDYLAAELFKELRNTPAQHTFKGRVLTAANRTVDVMGSSYHPLILANAVVGAFSIAA